MKKKVLFSGILLAFQVLLGHAQQRLLGGDISLLPSYEAAGTVYRNAVGEPVAPLDFFKEQGWNAVRVRLFVEPSKASAEHKGEGVCQDLDYVTKFGGTITEVEEWGKKKLAYEIQHMKEGYYYFIKFDGEATVPGELEQAVRIMDNVLRYLCVRQEA